MKESAVLWVKYGDALGVLRCESSGTEKEQEAREGAAVEGRAIDMTAHRVQRQNAGAVPATVIRELAALKRSSRRSVLISPSTYAPRPRSPISAAGGSRANPHAPVAPGRLRARRALVEADDMPAYITTQQSGRALRAAHRGVGQSAIISF